MSTDLKDDEYVLTEDAAWFTVKKFSIRIYTTDEGVVVDVFALGKEDTEPVTSTFAFDHEVEDEEEMVIAGPENCEHKGRRSMQDGIQYCKECGADLPKDEPYEGDYIRESK